MIVPTPRRPGHPPRSAAGRRVAYSPVQPATHHFDRADQRFAMPSQRHPSGDAEQLRRQRQPARMTLHDRRPGPLRPARPGHRCNAARPSNTMAPSYRRCFVRIVQLDTPSAYLRTSSSARPLTSLIEELQPIGSFHSAIGRVGTATTRGLAHRRFRDRGGRGAVRRLVDQRLRRRRRSDHRVARRAAPRFSRRNRPAVDRYANSIPSGLR